MGTTPWKGNTPKANLQPPVKDSVQLLLKNRRQKHMLSPCSLYIYIYIYIHTYNSCIQTQVWTPPRPTQYCLTKRSLACSCNHHQLQGKKRPVTLIPSCKFMNRYSRNSTSTTKCISHNTNILSFPWCVYNTTQEAWRQAKMKNINISLFQDNTSYINYSVI